MILKPVKHILNFPFVCITNSFYAGRVYIKNLKYLQHLGHSKKAMRQFFGTLDRPSLEAIVNKLGALPE